MRKQGLALKFAAVSNAILLAVGFIGCQSGAFNWLAEKGESPASTQNPDAPPTQEGTPIQQSSLPQQGTPAPPKSDPVFMSGTKSLLTGSFVNTIPSSTAQGGPAPADSQPVNIANPSQIMTPAFPPPASLSLPDRTRP
jgi:hypothetical protein